MPILSGVGDFNSDGSPTVVANISPAPSRSGWARVRAPSPALVAIGDVNGDGKPDLVVANVGK